MKPIFLALLASFVAIAAGCGAAPPAPVAPSAASASTSQTPTAGPLADHVAPVHPTPREALLVLAKRDRTMAIVDPETLAVLAKVSVGEDPHEVVATPDGRFAYASNYGGGAYNTLAVVDLVAQQPLPPIDLGALRGPHGLVARGGKIWFTAEAAKVVGAYDPSSQKIDWVIGTGQNRTHMIFVTEDLQRVVTTNVSSATVSFLDKIPPGHHDGPPPGPPGGPGGPPPPGAGANDHRPHGPPGGDWEQTVIPVGRGSEGFDVSPDGKEIWVANAQDGTVSIVDTATKAVTQTLKADVPGANRLKFTLDGKQVLVSSLRSGEVTVLDAHLRTQAKRIPVGRGASGILMQPGGARAFVACSPDDSVAVIDLKALAVVGHIDAGHEPDGMAWVQRP